MNYSQKVYAISLLILIGVAIFLYSMETPGDNYSGLGYSIGMMVFTAAEAIFLLIVAFLTRFQVVDFVKRSRPKLNDETLDDPGRMEVLKPGEKALTYVVAAGLVVVIGFSVCMGGISFLE